LALQGAKAMGAMRQRGVVMDSPEIEVHTSNRMDPGKVLVDLTHLEERAVCHH
jgi:hypothetical protein